MVLVFDSSDKKLFRQIDVRETANIGATPNIGDFSDAQHNHTSAATGGTISHVDLTNIGTNSHAQVDTHLANVTNPHGLTISDIPSKAGSITQFTTRSHTDLSNIGTNTHAQIDSYIATTAPATYAPIAKGVTNGDAHDHNGGDGAQVNHVNLSSIGTNTHAQIDSHIASTANPHSVTAAQASAVALTGNQSIDGVKTFTSFPVTPSSAPTTNYQTANKKYVDDSVTAELTDWENSISAGAMYSPTGSVVTTDDWLAWEMADGATTAVYFTFLPHTNISSTTITLRFCWYCAAAADKNAVFKVSWKYAGDGDDKDVYSGNSGNLTKASQGTDEMNYESVAMDLSFLTNTKPVCVKIERLGAEGDDTLSVSAFLVAAKLDLTI